MQTWSSGTQKIPSGKRRNIIMKKKLISTALATLMILATMLTMTACSSGDSASSGAKETGTYQQSRLEAMTIEQGKLNRGYFNAITLFDDNTYILTDTLNVYYSSDGGETFNPTYIGETVTYGTYEVVDTNEELGESTIKIATVDRIVMGEFDSAAAELTDEQKDYLANNGAIGTEIIVSSDHRMSDIVDITNFKDITTDEGALY
jgi:hypothetical protein